MNCEECAFFAYDEDYDDYSCTVDMDEDDFARLMGNKHEVCPFYRNGDEYAVVRHQM